MKLNIVFFVLLFGLVSCGKSAENTDSAVEKPAPSIVDQTEAKLNEAMKIRADKLQEAENPDDAEKGEE
ncbi:MAG: hypothetical protein DRR19_32050 [Candidatus Parabeggiatoa sp. nov. 1]|nr:MAG: hypothetical protein DRR19_32050 [Gammaproteobacteria bacterium]